MLLLCFILTFIIDSYVASHFVINQIFIFFVLKEIFILIGNFNSNCLLEGNL